MYKVIKATSVFKQQSFGPKYDKLVEFFKRKLNSPQNRVYRITQTSQGRLTFGKDLILPAAVDMLEILIGEKKVQFKNNASNMPEGIRIQLRKYQKMYITLPVKLIHLCKVLPNTIQVGRSTLLYASMVPRLVHQSGPNPTVYGCIFSYIFTFPCVLLYESCHQNCKFHQKKSFTDQHFLKICKDTSSLYVNLLYPADVKWPLRVKVLRRVFSNRR